MNEIITKIIGDVALDRWLRDAVEEIVGDESPNDLLYRLAIQAGLIARFWEPDSVDTTCPACGGTGSVYTEYVTSTVMQRCVHCNNGVRNDADHITAVRTQKLAEGPLKRATEWVKGMSAREHVTILKTAFRRCEELKREIKDAQATTDSQGQEINHSQRLGYGQFAAESRDDLECVLFLWYRTETPGHKSLRAALAGLDRLADERRIVIPATPRLSAAGSELMCGWWGSDGISSDD